MTDTSQALQTADAPAWSDFVVNFDDAYSKFETWYATLANQRAWITQYHPELLAQYNQLMTDGAAHDATLQQLRSVRDTVSSWLGSIGSGVANAYQSAVDFTSNAFSSIANLFNDADEQNLGFVPVIMGVAAATAALATIVYWINDAYQFNQKLQALQQLQKSGASPSEAANAISKIFDGGGLTGATGNLVTLAGLGIAGYLLFTFIGKKK